MKRGLHLLLALGLAVFTIGCAGEEKKTDTPDESAASSNVTNPTETADTTEVTGDFTLVSLNVPNMP